MTRFLNTLLLIALIGVVVLMGVMVNAQSVKDDFHNSENGQCTEIFDGQRSDIESYIEAAGSGITTLPEIVDSMPSPSVRLLTSQKRAQQNLSAFLMLKHLSSEVTPTNKYNKYFSLPLSAKENLIVIIKHLII